MNSMFKDLDYFIAYRFLQDGNKNIPNERGSVHYHVIKSKIDEWYADPFPLEFCGHYYIFAERMNKWRGRGSISFCEVYPDETHSEFKEILLEPFHLSYPNIFEYHNEIYMIPESGMNNDIRLYKATTFPYKWMIVDVIAEGHNYVDTSIIKRENNNFLLVTFDWNNKIQSFINYNILTREKTILPNNPKMMVERSGGNTINNIRVLQDCKVDYGTKIIFRTIENDDFAHGNGQDTRLCELTPNGITTDTQLKPLKIHTFNRSSSLEVIDILSCRKNILKQAIRVYHHLPNFIKA